MGILQAGAAAGGDIDWRISVAQLRHSNVSKSARSSRDLLACMAMPQTGQWRMLGRGCDVNFRSARSENNPPTSPMTAALELIQINAGGRALRGAAGPAGAAARAQNDLGQCTAWLSAQYENMWQNVSTAPFDRDLELAVIDDDGPHTLVFPCRRILNGWMKVQTKERLDVRPTHWREWQERRECEAGR